MQNRNRQRAIFTLDDETRETLRNLSEVSNMSMSKVVDIMARVWRDMSFEEETLPLANLLRKYLGKKPLKSKYWSYKDIWKS